MPISYLPGLVRTGSYVGLGWCAWLAYQVHIHGPEFLDEVKVRLVDVGENGKVFSQASLITLHAGYRLNVSIFRLLLPFMADIGKIAVEVISKIPLEAQLGLGALATLGYVLYHYRLARHIAFLPVGFAAFCSLMYIPPEYILKLIIPSLSIWVPILMSLLSFHYRRSRECVHWLHYWSLLPLTVWATDRIRDTTQPSPWILRITGFSLENIGKLNDTSYANGVPALPIELESQINQSMIAVRLICVALGYIVAWGGADIVSTIWYTLVHKVLRETVFQLKIVIKLWQYGMQLREKIMKLIFPSTVGETMQRVSYMQKAYGLLQHVSVVGAPMLAAAALVFFLGLKIMWTIFDWLQYLISGCLWVWYLAECSRTAQHRGSDSRMRRSKLGFALCFFISEHYLWHLDPTKTLPWFIQSILPVNFATFHKMLQIPLAMLFNMAGEQVLDGVLTLVPILGVHVREKMPFSPRDKTGSGSEVSDSPTKGDEGVAGSSQHSGASPLHGSSDASPVHEAIGSDASSTKPSRKAGGASSAETSPVKKDGPTPSASSTKVPPLDATGALRNSTAALHSSNDGSSPEITPRLNRSGSGMSLLLSNIGRWIDPRASQPLVPADVIDSKDRSTAGFSSSNHSGTDCDQGSSSSANSSSAKGTTSSSSTGKADGRVSNEKRTTLPTKKGESQGGSKSTRANSSNNMATSSNATRENQREEVEQEIRNRRPPINREGNHQQEDDRELERQERLGWNRIPDIGVHTVKTRLGASTGEKEGGGEPKVKRRRSQN